MERLRVAEELEFASENDGSASSLSQLHNAASNAFHCAVDTLGKVIPDRYTPVQKNSELEQGHTAMQKEWGGEIVRHKKAELQARKEERVHLLDEIVERVEAKNRYLHSAEKYETWCEKLEDRERKLSEDEELLQALVAHKLESPSTKQLKDAYNEGYERVRKDIIADDQSDCKKLRWFTQTNKDIEKNKRGGA